jgi:hypothetical protein
MNEEMNDEQLESLLRAAMKSRTEPAHISNLAEVVISRARAVRQQSQSQAAWLAIQARWNRIITAAAVVLIALVLAVGIHRLKTVISAISDSTDATTTATASSSWLDDTFGSSSQISAGTEIAWLGGCIVIVALTAVILFPSSSRDPLRM